MTDYASFLDQKTQLANAGGFDPIDLPDFLFPFQRALVDWTIRQGRAGLFADCGLGKAQPVDEPVLTPGGWRPIGSLGIGDAVIAVDGSSALVVGVHPQGHRPVYTVTFNDGSSTRVDLDHLWTVATDLDISRGRPWRTLTTRALMEKGLTLPPRGGPRWRIPIARPAIHPTAALPIDPYVMGVLLGDGSLRPPFGPEFTTVDPEIAAEVKSRLPAGMRLSTDPGERAPVYRPVMDLPIGSGRRTNRYLEALREWGLQGRLSYQKFIPPEYLTASVDQRLDLLRGLMDTDGYVSTDGTIQFGSSSPALSDGVLALVRSLGGVARRTAKIPTYTHHGEKKEGRRHFTLTIALPDGTVPFLLPRKVTRCVNRYYAPQRKITSITPAVSDECVCITIDHPAQLYVTRDYIVTHNSPMALVWANNVHRHTGKPVLFVTPLAVGFQIEMEAHKFGVDAAVSRDGKVAAPVTITNYERLEKFAPAQFGGVVCDESSAIKAFDGVRRAIVTEFLRQMPYRLLCTATAAPNDYVELGTASEALGQLGHIDMLNRFFINAQRTSDTRAGGRFGAKNREGWRFKGHGQDAFWRWVASWARAIRKPSDFGFPDDGFVLPPLEQPVHMIEARTPRPDTLFDVPASGLAEEREVQRRTIQERCEEAAKAISDASSAVAWCNLNDESARLVKLIDGAVEVSGADSIESKEEKLQAFTRGEFRVLVTKPVVGAWGLNWQHCHRMTYFPSHCYDDQTEVLTRTGWKTFGKVSLDDDLATVDQTTHAFEWQAPTRVVWEPYSGPMLHFQGMKSFDLMVTPNHNLFVQRCPTRYPGTDGRWQLMHASRVADRFRRQEYRMMSVPASASGDLPAWVDIPLSPGWVPQPLAGHGEAACSISGCLRVATARGWCRRHYRRWHRLGSPTSGGPPKDRVVVSRIEAEDFMRLAGWYLSEGHCRPMGTGSAGRIVLCQTDKNPEYRAEIIALMQRIGLNVNSRTKDITGSSVNLAAYLIEQFGSGSYTKRIPRWVKDLHPDLLTILRDTMMKGDGAATGAYYKSFSPQLRDDFQEVCLRTGVRASVHNDYVSLAWKNLRPSVHRPPERVHYEGMIGCATVPNHTLIVRRNGIPVVSGNSYEQMYQAIRRSWRFGQQHPVTVDIIITDGGAGILANLQRKAAQADAMFDALVQHMNQATAIRRGTDFPNAMEIPSWLQ